MSLSIENRPAYNDPSLWGVIFFAFICQLLFYTGVFGSDEMTYNKAAIDFLNGESESANYIGSIRYGINIPVAFFFSIFGINEISANIWSFLCSLGEVVLVFLFTKRFFDKKTAVIAALILATIPVHLHFSGRMMADNPLSFFLALSFYWFIIAEQKNSAKYFLIAGVAFGFTYWLKASVTVMLAPIFIIYALTTKQYNKNWQWLILGGAIVWIGHFLLMWVVHGNPLHHINTMLSSLDKITVSSSVPSYDFYLTKLFVDIRHTWLLGPLAFIGIFILRKKSQLKENKFIFIWFFWALFVLSLVSIQQKNYLLLFCFPLSIFAALCLSRIKPYQFLLMWLPMVLILAGLKQQDIRNFNSNSQALSSYTSQSPNQLIIASQRGANIHYINQLLLGTLTSNNQPMLLEDTLLDKKFLTSTSAQTVILSVDQETLSSEEVKQSKKYVELHQACFTPMPVLTPQGFGSGLVLLKGMMTVIEVLVPNSMASRTTSFLEKFTQPKPMYLYQGDVNCIKNSDEANMNVERKGMELL
ncbi:MAG: glycosyltransferase family 39 protein [Colwellia sp.]|nr:glycosyltransferase family 39 protein [Colwellia sp.]